MNERLLSFFENPNSLIKSTLLAIREMIMNSNLMIKETIKYGMPCYVIDHKPICYVWIDRKSSIPYILFVDGKKLHHPVLQSGTRKKMKVLLIDPSNEIPSQLIDEILTSAVTLKLGQIK